MEVKRALVLLGEIVNRTDQSELVDAAERFIRNLLTQQSQDRELRGYAQDALTILENAHFPPFDQEQSPDAIAVIEGLRSALAASPGKGAEGGHHNHDFSIEHLPSDPGEGYGDFTEWECSICHKTPDQVRADRTDPEAAPIEDEERNECPACGASDCTPDTCPGYAEATP